MSLTDRSKEFFAALRKLCDEQSGPVHYEAVARAVGVSKWTAYDMLRKLAADGLVRVEYILNRESRTPGRSMVVFCPRYPGALSDGPSSRKPESEGGGGRLVFSDELHILKRRLLNYLSELPSLAAQDSWDSFMERLDEAKGPAAFCGYMVVLLLACARFLGGDNFSAVMQLTRTTVDAHSALTLFSGAIIGMLLVRVPESTGITSKIADYLRRFQGHVDSLDGQERAVLLEFVREMAGVT